MTEKCTEVCTANDKKQPRVIFMHNNLLMTLCSKIPNLQNRATLVYNLIKAYNLLNYVKVVNVIPATVENLCNFHSPLYIEFLKNLSEKYTLCTEESKEHVEELFSDESEDFGIGYDCPVVEHVFLLASLIAGSSIIAAKKLCDGTADTAINWYGGWHHAQRDQAEGFCYVNDIVLAIEELRATFGNVLYIDLDIHHGNGVENAYNFSRKVFTLSFHKYEMGFYPGSGGVADVGVGKGKFYTVNVPLKEGMCDSSFCDLFKRITDEVLLAYQPNAIVLQCGADGLTGDKLGGFNLTLTSYGYCVRKVLTWKKPTLVLGGGGYNKTNVARCWTYITSLIAGCAVSKNIPDNENFLEYGPDFALGISPSNRKNYNDKEYLNSLLKTIIGNIKNNVTPN